MPFTLSSLAQARPLNPHRKLLGRKTLPFTGCRARAATAFESAPPIGAVGTVSLCMDVQRRVPAPAPVLTGRHLLDAKSNRRILQQAESKL